MDLFNREALALAGERLSGERLAHQMERELAETRLGYLNEARAEITELKIKNAVLNERLDLLTSGVLDAKPAPAAWTEDVEDAEYLFRTGRLDRGEFEAALEAAGFANTEIEFDSASLPLI